MDGTGALVKLAALSIFLVCLVYTVHNPCDPVACSLAFSLPLCFLQKKYEL